LYAKALGGVSDELYNLIPMKHPMNQLMASEFENPIGRGLANGRYQRVYYMVQGNFEGNTKYADSVNLVGVALDGSGVPVWQFNTSISTH